MLISNSILTPVSQDFLPKQLAEPLDFTSLFNWNTKQIFVWVLANYPASGSTPDVPSSQAIIWDAIINSETQKNPLNPFQFLLKSPKAPKKSASSKNKPKSKQEVQPQPGIIQLKNSKPKYQITDISGKLSARNNVTLEVGWNVQPWVGALTWTLTDGQSWGRWHGLHGGRSKAFDMPELKVKGVNQNAVKGAGKPEKAAEASPIVK